MKTKEQLIAELKNENPTLRRGSEEDGYEEIIGEEYDAIIESWAEARLNRMEKENEEIARLEKKAEAEKKLAALGLSTDDLKALGLG